MKEEKLQEKTRFYVEVRLVINENKKGLNGIWRKEGSLLAKRERHAAY